MAGTVVDGSAISFRGTSSVATTVNAAGSTSPGGGAELWALMKSGDAFINGGSSQVILFPTGAGVAATLFGGTASTDIDVGAGGWIQGGTGGNNVLFGSTVAGSTTLVGGGAGDVLVQQSNANTDITGAGNENLFAFASGDLYKEGVSGANNASIYGAASGSDTISLSNPAGGTYSLLGNTTTAPIAGQVAYQTAGGNTTVSFGDGTTWTVFGTQLQNSDFH